jgi:O-antigen ligase
MLPRRQLLSREAVRIVTESGAWRRSRRTGEYDRAAHIAIWIFMLFVASLPFESVAYQGRGEGLASISSAIGYVLILAAAYRSNVFFRKPVRGVGFFMIWVFLSWGYCLVLQPHDLLKVYVTLVRRTQMVVLLWISASLLRDEKLARRTLLVLAVSCAALFLYVHTIGGGDPGDATMADDRLSVFEEDPNFLASLVSMGVLAYLALPIMGMKHKLIKTSAWLVGMLGSASVVLQTGSRSAIIGLVAAMPMLALQPGRPMARLRRLALVVAACGAFVFAVTAVPMTRVRFEAALKGKLGMREKFIPAAIAMFWQEPLWGWGTIDAMRELRRRESGRTSLAVRATHNIFLAPLLESGLLGGAPYLLGCGLAWLTAWRCRNGPRGIVPLVYVVLLFGTGLGFNIDAGKGYWLFLGYVFASYQRGWLRNR